jgi:hypothetical protein
MQDVVEETVEEQVDESIFGGAEGDEGEEGEGSAVFMSSLFAMTQLTGIVDKHLKALGVDMDVDGPLVFPDGFDADAFCNSVAKDSNVDPMMVHSVLEALINGPMFGDEDEDEDSVDYMSLLGLGGGMEE